MEKTNGKMLYLRMAISIFRGKTPKLFFSKFSCKRSIQDSVRHLNRYPIIYLYL